MVSLGSRWTDFYEIWYLSFSEVFRESVVRLVSRWTGFYEIWYLSFSEVFRESMVSLGSRRTDFYEIWYLSFFVSLSRKSTFHQNVARVTGTFHEGQYIFMIISRSVILGMRNASDIHYR